MPSQPLASIILKGLALAMGVAAVVLAILGASTATGLITLLGVGLFSLSLWAFRKGE